MQKIHLCIHVPLTPDGHGTSEGDHGAWLSLDDGFGEVPCKELGGKQVGVFESGPEKVTLGVGWHLR